MERPNLDRQTDSKLFREFYYLKEELVQFCRENGLPTSGSKEVLTERIAYYLETGTVKKTASAPKKRSIPTTLTLDTKIEENFVCSEVHRAFFKEQIGHSFSFNVAFQKWLKANAGKTYQEAVEAYEQILRDKKTTKTSIDRQFEYNTYIRDFFEDNKGKSLNDAILCWKYKKSKKGHNKYEQSDLAALNN